jgi:hypothetical protein
MFEHYHWAYLLGDFLFGFPIWLLLFFVRKDLRREMLIGSILLAIGSVLFDHVFWRDYWHPEDLAMVRVTLGDFWYGFFSGGIASVAYEVLYKKHFSQRRNRQHHWIWFFIPVAFFGIAIFCILPYFFGINSIYSICLALFSTSVFMIILRRDLFFDSLASGTLLSIVTLVGYFVSLKIFPGILAAWWNLPNLSGIKIYTLPVEELLFAFCLGIAIGPAYEFFTGAQFLKRGR